MNIPFNKSFASHEKAKYWSKDNNLQPSDVYKFSNKKAKFNCITCNHTFNATISNISNGQWCSYCNGDKLCNDDNCEYCFNKSVASLEISKYWSELNKIQPRYVLRGSKQQCLFNCNKCNHLFSIVIYRIQNDNGWCPYCVNKLCNNHECEICFQNSFASCEMAKYWSNDNTIKPKDVRKSSIKKFIFKCPGCNHKFSSPLNNVIRGTWCPYCCKNSIILCTDSKCTLCFEKSFASSKMVSYWSNKNNINPRYVYKKQISNIYLYVIYVIMNFQKDYYQ
jgi:hypothetical protein